jgi:hypothetical protein
LIRIFSFTLKVLNFIGIALGIAEFVDLARDRKKTPAAALIDDSRFYPIYAIPRLIGNRRR